MLVCLDAPCLINTVSQKPQFLAGIFSPARICPDQSAPPPGCPCISIGMTSSTSHLGPKSIGDNLQVGSLVIEVFQTRFWRQMAAIWRARRFPASIFDRSFSVADQNISTTPSSPDYRRRRPKGRKSLRGRPQARSPAQAKFWSKAHACEAGRLSVGIDRLAVKLIRYWCRCRGRETLQTSPSTSLTRIGRGELGQVDCTDEPHTPYVDWANLTRPSKDSRVRSLEDLYDRRVALQQVSKPAYPEPRVARLSDLKPRFGALRFTLLSTSISLLHQKFFPLYSLP